MDQLADVTVTTATRAEAETLTRQLVDDRLVACGNIAAVHSIYRWEGDVADEPETLVVLHTRASLVPDLIERVTVLHPYDEPQIVAIPVLAAAPGYHAWVLESTREPRAT
ncbi:divalent-cation tolerance protein CutA [Pseudoclavibacter endophyticus]|uniref:divalent-cation tolerance protein CutA n=1 Tax=Pseudoclavibacter endophyticus TaxID=1778590 RepID=UPI0019A9221B|nr:divalent-cation tolerance protein CutA [Pseudoclavibacter endophyticus]GGA71084.1 divalent-cation tolerance protein CutA [Pseudoclavibacter endophyticus]